MMATKWPMRRLFLAAMVCTLQACGGGGSTSNPDTQALPSNAQASAFDGSHQWVVNTVDTDVSTVDLPYPSTFLTGGAGSAIYWAKPSGGQMELNVVEPSSTNGWQSVKTLMSGLPMSLQQAQRQVVRAGAWTLLVWNPYAFGSTSNSIYARLVGPGVDSGPVEIAHDLFMVFDLWPTVSADGHARIYWADPDDHTSTGWHLGGHFEGPNWVADPPIAINSTSDRLLVDADGQGWLQEYGLRRLDAATGIGPRILSDANFEGGTNVTAGRFALPLPGSHILFASSTTSSSTGTGCVQAVEVDANLKAQAERPCLNLLDPNTSAVGNALGASTDDSGRALLVWSDTNDHQLYAAARSAQGQWTPLGMAADHIYNRVAWPFSPQAVLGPNGRMAIVFSSEQGDPAYHPEAMTYTLFAVQWDGTKWGTVSQLTSMGASTEAVKAAFDKAGNLGVLSIEAKDGAESVRFWTSKDGMQWSDQVLQAGLNFTHLTFIGRSYIRSDLRLNAASDGSWTASWVSTSASGFRINGATLR